MDLDDNLVRTIVICLLLGWAGLWLVGGMLTRVAGAWRDGARVVVLEQFGPRVWGHTEWQGGRQDYRGWVRFFGRVRLRRRDAGTAHLTSLGFTAAQGPALQGQTMAHLDFVVHADRLEGEFHGRRFSFDADNKRVREVKIVAADRRVWMREKMP